MASRITKILGNMQNHAVAAAFIIGILMLLIPVPGVLLDFLMICNVGASIIVLLVVLYTPKSSDFSSFPRVLIFTTLFGTALNVCSTRLILTEAARTKYLYFPGQMLKAFSSIVTGDSPLNPSSTGLIIGLVVFVILIIFQAVVITKGATRVSEVAARFSLDAMNQKFFAVDSELSSGYITDEEAREKKASIQRDIDFYSSMDGAGKFVSGNVKAGIAITAIDLIAGIITGMIIGGMDIGEAASTYSRLTIGDGLLSQLPALLVSVATGILVTGNSDESLIGEQLKKQFTVSGYIYVIAGVTLALMSFIPGFPWYLLIPIGGLLFFYGYRLVRGKKQSFDQELQRQQDGDAAASNNENGEIRPIVPLDALSLELGYALIPLVNKENGAELLERVSRLRREAALDLGLVVPKIRIIDNMQLNPDEYSFKIRGIEKGRSRIKLGYYMCMNTGTVLEEIKGEATTDPAFGVPAIWVSEDRRSEAENAGYAVVDPPTIIATHLTEIIRANAAEILGRLETKAIVDAFNETNSVVVGEVLNTYKYTYGEIEKVLQGLLREQVSIRNIVTILETLANFGNIKTIRDNTWALIEKVREALGVQICLQYADQDKKLSVLQLSQSASQLILEHTVVPPDGGQPTVAFDAETQRRWISSISAAFAAQRERNYLPIILCDTSVRALVKSSVDIGMPGTIVLSISEVLAAGHNVHLEIIGEINV